MPMLDVFSSSAFDMSSLTVAVDKLPTIPGRIGRMKLFQDKGIVTLTAQVEERHGKLTLIPQAARGTNPLTTDSPTREVRSFTVPHLPFDDTVMADEVQGVRAFGQESQLETVSQIVNDKMTVLKQSHEMTWEYHRAGALQGIVLDASGSTIFNWFTEFGITETVVDFDFLGVGVPKTSALTVVRAIKDALGATPFTKIRALCGNTFFDELVNHDDVKAAYERFQDGAFLRNIQIDETGFEFAGIIWENYDHSVGGTEYIPLGTARFFPIGTPNIFVRANAPANFMETVNTIGKPIYAKQEKLPMDVGQRLHTQSNPLHICTRPAVLVKGTNT